VAEINVAGDASALLAMAPYDGPNGQYAAYDNDGALYLDLTTLLSSGVNVDAQTRFENVFTITNNGTQTITVVLGKGAELMGNIEFYDIEDGVTLDVGETYVVSLLVDTNGLKDQDTMLTTFTITATAGGSVDQGADDDDSDDEDSDDEDSDDDGSDDEDSDDEDSDDDGNNGHGNDEDGVDESNPGNSGGNNGNHNGQN
jgi:hypothetical protein